MALPKAVQRQADEAERILLEHQQASESALVEKDADDEMEEIEQPSTPDWEHKFNVLQGKYNAEIPRLNQELHRLRDQNIKLQDQIEELSRKPVEEAPKLDFTTIRDELGDDAADAFNRQQELIERQSKMIDELEKKIGQVGQASQQSSEQSFYSTLKSLVPDWESVNTNSNFIAWLGEEDGYSGKTRHESMNEAASFLDVNRVARFFTDWKQASAKSKKGIEKQVAPSTSKSSTPVKGASAYTRAEVAKFYDDVARGKYRHDPDRLKQMDYDITRAQAEGRITG